jgi:hypothetical protein
VTNAYRDLYDATIALTSKRVRESIDDFVAKAHDHPVARISLEAFD